MADVREKKQDPAPNVKELLTGFETGKLQNGAAPKVSEERPISRPGGAKKLALAYEKIGEPAAAPQISRKTPKTPTTPTTPTAPTTQTPTPEVQEVQTQSAATTPESVAPVAQAPVAQAPVAQAPAASTPNAPGVQNKYNVLVVYADMERGGFNGEVLDNTVQSLEKNGHSVEVADLYRSGFNPLPTRADAGVTDNRGNFLYEESMLAANQTKKVSPDIQAEQQKIQKANLVVFIFRFQPSGIPAMLQGYVDRVLSPGFGADLTTKTIFEGAKLAGKKAVLCMSSLLNAATFSDRSLFGDLDVYLWPLQFGALRFCGFDILSPQMNDNYFYGGDAQQKSLMSAWTTRLSQIFTEPAQSYAPLSCFTEQDFLLPKAEVAKKAVGFNVAQHLGKGF